MDVPKSPLYLPTGKVKEDWRAITLTVDKVEKIIR